MLRRRLCSAELDQELIRLAFGDRSFAVASQGLWKILPTWCAVLTLNWVNSRDY